MRSGILALVAGALVVALLLPGCAAHKKIAYPVTDVERVPSMRFAGNTLRVAIFADQREPIPKRDPGSVAPWQGPPDARIVQRSNVDWYFNHTDHYKEKTVAPWLSQMLATHLAATQMFAAVSSEAAGSTSSDYVLEGTIKKFEGFKERSPDAEDGMQFGLIGGLLTAGAKSRYEGTTLLVDLRLVETASGKIIWGGTVLGHVEGVDAADARGWQAYQVANLSLKKAVDNLVEELKQIN